STPGSAIYGQYLSAAQFRQRFAPSQADVNTIKSWLTAQGFNIVYVPSNNHSISAEGTLAQATAAFGTSFGLYSVEGMTLSAPNSDLVVPASVAPIISGVLGLDQTAQLVHTDMAGGNDPGAVPSPAFVNAPPCSRYWGEKTTSTIILNPISVTNPYGAGHLPYAPRGYRPQQVKCAYGLSGASQD